MKSNPCFERTISRYKRAGYSDQAINYLEYLESRCERLCLLLEEYKHLQPEGELFSEKNIEIIVRLHDLYEEVHRKEEKLRKLKKSIAECYREIACLKSGVECQEASEKSLISEDTF